MADGKHRIHMKPIGQSHLEGVMDCIAHQSIHKAGLLLLRSPTGPCQNRQRSQQQVVQVCHAGHLVGRQSSQQLGHKRSLRQRPKRCKHTCGFPITVGSLLAFTSRPEHNINHFNTALQSLHDLTGTAVLHISPCSQRV